MKQPATDLSDRYRVSDLIAHGGMADVYAGFDLLLERPVAIKVLHTEATDDAPRLLHETQALARLNHPAIVRLFDAGAHEGQLFLVMELVEGESLRDRLRRGELPAEEAARVGSGVAAGLAHAHAARIVHRDVKPANILLDEEQRPRLADFGIARLLDGTRTTIAGATMGTAAYLAPEQVSGDDVTEAADVYALGLVLLEALTGRAAFVGTAVEVALARLSRRPAIPASLGPGWVALLEDMTAADPGRRPSAEAAAARLETLADPTATSTLVPPLGGGRGSTVRTAPARGRRRLMAGVAASMLVLASAAVLAGSRQEAPVEDPVEETGRTRLQAEREPEASEEPAEPTPSPTPDASGSRASASHTGARPSAPAPPPEPQETESPEEEETEEETEEPAETEPPAEPEGNEGAEGEGPQGDDSGESDPSETDAPDPPTAAPEPVPEPTPTEEPESSSGPSSEEATG